MTRNPRMGNILSWSILEGISPRNYIITEFRRHEQHAEDVLHFLPGSNTVVGKRAVSRQTDGYLNLKRVQTLSYNSTGLHDSRPVRTYLKLRILFELQNKPLTALGVIGHLVPHVPPPAVRTASSLEDGNATIPPHPAAERHAMDNSKKRVPFLAVEKAARFEVPREVKNETTFQEVFSLTDTSLFFQDFRRLYPRWVELQRTTHNCRIYLPHLQSFNKTMVSCACDSLHQTYAYAAFTFNV